MAVYQEDMAVVGIVLEETTSVAVVVQTPEEVLVDSHCAVAVVGQMHLILALELELAVVVVLSYTAGECQA